jgi:hypothetical protein
LKIAHYIQDTYNLLLHEIAGDLSMCKHFVEQSINFSVLNNSRN